MKKLKNILLILVIAFLLTGCNNQKNSKDLNENNNNNNNIVSSNYNEKIEFNIKDKIVYTTIEEYFNNEYYDGYTINQFIGETAFSIDYGRFESMYDCDSYGLEKGINNIFEIKEDEYKNYVNSLNKYTSCINNKIKSLNDGININSDNYIKERDVDLLYSISDLNLYLYLTDNKDTEIIDFYKYILNEYAQNNTEGITYKDYSFIADIYPIYINDKIIDLKGRLSWYKDGDKSSFDEKYKIFENKLKTFPEKYYDKHNIPFLTDDENLKEYAINEEWSFENNLSQYEQNVLKIKRNTLFAYISYKNNISFEDGKPVFKIGKDYLKEIMNNPSAENITKLGNEYDELSNKTYWK